MAPHVNVDASLHTMARSTRMSNAQPPSPRTVVQLPRVGITRRPGTAAGDKHVHGGVQVWLQHSSHTVLRVVSATRGS